jgi:hypothetical protein
MGLAAAQVASAGEDRQSGATLPPMNDDLGRGGAGEDHDAAALAPSGAEAKDLGADPLTRYQSAVIDLLGALALGELTAFERLAEDARLAPTIEDRTELAAMAVAEFHHYEKLRARLVDLGVDPPAAMAPFVSAFEEFHRRTAPSDWFEGLVKAYVGDGIAADFYREVAALVDEDTRRLVTEVLDDTGHADFAVARVRSAIEADPRLGGRLALWGRRLVGEALSQAQRVAADRDAMSELLAGTLGEHGLDLAEVGRMFARITDAHSKRMAALGLTA